MRFVSQLPGGGDPPPDHPPGEDGERAGLTGQGIMTSPPALSLSPYVDVAAAGRQIGCECGLFLSCPEGETPLRTTPVRIGSGRG